MGEQRIDSWAWYRWPLTGVTLVYLAVWWTWIGWSLPWMKTFRGILPGMPPMTVIDLVTWSAVALLPFLAQLVVNMARLEPRYWRFTSVLSFAAGLALLSIGWLALIAPVFIDQWRWSSLSRRTHRAAPIWVHGGMPYVTPTLLVMGIAAAIILIRRYEQRRGADELISRWTLIASGSLGIALLALGMTEYPSLSWPESGVEMATVWFGTAVAILLPARAYLAWAAWRRATADPDWFCSGCRYDLRGSVAPACPECGQVLDERRLAAREAGGSTVHPPLTIHDPSTERR